MRFLATETGLLLPVVIILVSCALALLPYFMARAILLPRTDDQSKDLASSVMFRVGALHGLILALVFAQELVNFNDVRHTLTREAALVGNIFYDLERYDKTTTQSARASLIEYTNIVLNREWDALAETGRLDEQAWDEWKTAYLAILDLAPQTPRQEALKGIMLDQVRELSELRLDREGSALVSTNNFFLLAAIAGIIIMSITYFAFPPNVVNLTLLLLFGIYTGLIIYFIIAFANPFGGAGFIEPVRFERLYEGMLKSQP
jgi:hypothetical protein